MPAKIFNFFYEGIRNMSGHSRKLWIIIIIKLVIIFAILRIFLFPDFLNSRYDTEKEKIDHVTEQLINN
jgi:hypothetical protein